MKTKRQFIESLLTWDYLIHPIDRFHFITVPIGSFEHKLIATTPGKDSAYYSKVLEGDKPVSSFLEEAKESLITYFSK